MSREEEFRRLRREQDEATKDRARKENERQKLEVERLRKENELEMQVLRKIAIPVLEETNEGFLNRKGRVYILKAGQVLRVPSYESCDKELVQGIAAVLVNVYNKKRKGHVDYLEIKLHTNTELEKIATIHPSIELNGKTEYLKVDISGSDAVENLSNAVFEYITKNHGLGRYYWDYDDPYQFYE